MQLKHLLPGVWLALASLTTPAMAEFKGVLHAGYEVGGDNLLKAYYVDGSSASIDAGDGLVLAGGIAYLFNPQVALQTTLGWKYQTIKQASNGDADFTRFPLEALLQYTIMEKVRVSAGMTRHLSPKLSTSGLLSGNDLSFEDANGVVFQLDYVTESGLIWGIRKTDITYKVKGSSAEADGGSLGIHITGLF